MFLMSEQVQIKKNPQNCAYTSHKLQFRLWHILVQYQISFWVYAKENCVKRERDERKNEMWNSLIFKLWIELRHDPSVIQFLTRALDSVRPLSTLYHRKWLCPRRYTDFAQSNTKTRPTGRLLLQLY